MGIESWLDCIDKSQILIYDDRPVYVLVPGPFQEEYGDDNESYHIKETRYDGYGHFGGYDIYELAADWNREALRAQIGLPDKRVEKIYGFATAGYPEQSLHKLALMIEPKPRLENYGGFYDFQKEEMRAKGMSEDEIEKAEAEDRMKHYKAAMIRYATKTQCLIDYFTYSYDDDHMKAKYGETYKREIGIAIANHDTQNVHFLPYPIEITHDPNAVFDKKTPSLRDEYQGRYHEPEKLTLEDVTGIEYTSGTYNSAAHTEIGVFHAFIKNEPVSLWFETEWHDDEDITFTIRTNKYDLWEQMHEEDLCALNETLYDKMIAGRYIARISDAKTPEALEDIRYEFMEDERTTGSIADNIKRALSQKEEELAAEAAKTAATKKDEIPLIKAAHDPAIEQIKEVLEDQGVRYSIGEKDVQVEFWTSSGQDIPVIFAYDGTPGNLVDTFREYAENYDVDSEVESYIGMRGQNGIPSTVREILEDCEEAKAKLMEISGAMESALSTAIEDEIKDESGDIPGSNFILPDSDDDPER